MSDFTKLVRFMGYGSVLDAVEMAERTVTTAANNPSPENLAGAAASAAAATQAVAGALPTTGAQAHTVATVALRDIGALVNASATQIIAAKLGPAASFAEPVVQSLLTEFEAWLASKL